MYFILFEGTPRRNAKTAAGAAGAFISCWIERPTLKQAIRVAREGITAQGWIVDDKPDEAYKVDAATYPPGKDGREYFEQALLDKTVWVFHQFPDVDEE
jgi:hypothetical protein